MNRRHQQLYAVVDHVKPKSIVETGTWNGINAINMATIALKYHKEVEYIGFDLFGEEYAEEDKGMSAKEPCSIEDVMTRMEEFRKKNPGFKYTLYKGHTKNLVLQIPPIKADFAFIDGGHSIETIRTDYEMLKDCKVILFDDYYTPDDNGKHVDITKYGCNQLVETLDAAILPIRTPNKYGGEVGMVVYPTSASPFPMELKVKTQNSVPNEQIHANIRYSTTVIKKWAPCCSPHGYTGVLVSAGPSYLDHIEAIRRYNDSPDHKVFCVKTNHNTLIENGIVPFGCILLDPRAKVRRFVTPHKDVAYFAASMVHPSTVDLLKEYKTYLYNAVVGANEIPIMDASSNDARSKRLVPGGSGAATRAIMVLRLLGFRKIVLVGYDCCFREAMDENETTKTGQKKYWKVNKFGKEFWTSLELVAQIQDMDKILEHLSQDPTMEITAIGDGIIPLMVENMLPKLDSFVEEFSGV